MSPKVSFFPARLCCALLGKARCRMWLGAREDLAVCGGGLCLVDSKPALTQLSLALASLALLQSDGCEGASSPLYLLLQSCGMHSLEIPENAADAELLLLLLTVRPCLHASCRAPGGGRLAVACTHACIDKALGCAAFALQSLAEESGERSLFASKELRDAQRRALGRSVPEVCWWWGWWGCWWWGCSQGWRGARRTCVSQVLRVTIALGKRAKTAALKTNVRRRRVREALSSVPRDGEAETPGEALNKCVGVGLRRPCGARASGCP